MRKAIPFLATVLCGLLAAAGAHAAKPARQQSADPGGKTYKWVDENGITHYGDTVPQEYSQREQQILNSHGVEVQKRQAEMRRDLRAAEQRQKADADAVDKLRRELEALKREMRSAGRARPDSVAAAENPSRRRKPPRGETGDLPAETTE